VRPRGTHIVMQLRRDDTTITVPVPDHAGLRVGTLLAVIRQCGLPSLLFEEASR
jgi:predicted RNA binding protein YcfA (HicA-like mRNA interferase family)